MVSITDEIIDEIIDAIIQNERRHVCRPARTRRPPAPRSMASLRPDWSQLPPEDPDTRKGPQQA